MTVAGHRTLSMGPFPKQPSPPRSFADVLWSSLVVAESCKVTCWAGYFSSWSVSTTSSVSMRLSWELFIDELLLSVNDELLFLLRAHFRIYLWLRCWNQEVKFFAVCHAKLAVSTESSKLSVYSFAARGNLFSEIHCLQLLQPIASWHNWLYRPQKLVFTAKTVPWIKLEIG